MTKLENYQRGFILTENQKEYILEESRIFWNKLSVLLLNAERTKQDVAKRIFKEYGSD